ncbi:unnamed protein product, partial [Rotaria socialis]
DNYGEHQLMLAKVGKTSLTLAVRSRSDTKIKVSVKYGSSTPLKLRINKNISNHELMHKIADEAIEEMFLRPNEITNSLGLTEWIVTSTSIINSLDPSGIERDLYQLSTVPDFEDSVLRFRRKFQSDYHDKKLIILRLHYKQWMYPDATTKITENTKHEPSSWKKVEISFIEK